MLPSKARRRKKNLPTVISRKNYSQSRILNTTPRSQIIAVWSVGVILAFLLQHEDYRREGSRPSLTQSSRRHHLIVNRSQLIVVNALCCSFLSMQINESMLSISRTASRICSDGPIYLRSMLPTMSTSIVVIDSGYEKSEKSPRPWITRSQMILSKICCVPIESLLSSQWEVIVLKAPM